MEIDSGNSGATIRLLDVESRFDPVLTACMYLKQYSN